MQIADLIRRIVSINDRAKKGPVPDSEVLPVLKEALAALPAAWKDHGGVSEGLSGSIENTIRRAEEGMREDPVQLLGDLVEWEQQMGGWEAPVWDRARRYVHGTPTALADNDFEPM